MTKHSLLDRYKLYPNACDVLGIKCFYDDTYMCLCDNDGRVDCLIFNHSSSNCTMKGYCFNDALCLEPKSKTVEIDFACVCRSCYYGNLCQFTTTTYSISLDAIISSEIIVGKSLLFQTFIIKFVLIIVLLLVFIGFIFNTVSIIIVRRSKGPKAGLYWYLICLSLIGQFGLNVFATKYIYLLDDQMSLLPHHRNINYYCCITLDFFLSCLPSMFDWFTACIALERAINVVRGVTFDKILSEKVSKYIFIIVILFNILTSIHEPLSRELIEDPRIIGHSSCVIKYKTDLLKKYAIFVNIFHLTVPFMVNITSTIVFLISQTTRKSNSLLICKQSKQPFYSMLKKQIIFYKPIVISPLILICLQFPRLVLTFVFACVEYSWQRNLYFASYLIAYIPLMGTLIIYILPSPVYKEELLNVLINLKIVFNRIVECER
ncbi:unnamed protein product [Didymodactylos carnosus]|uniref:G-protein coupled receptors family 1 profile domain-containing protein n=1 Tax=Didymodactylos carnosus TaxID=1234261 RepID=A0A8S2FVR7_9BILA|nr:unnamed protein product [Didymodactylos carnosus]CAF4348968.1 unnamed protein product [Didymodactylos carnosus]